MAAYIPRLLCLAGACFFLVYASLTVAVACCSAKVLRAADRNANLLLGMRLLPFCVAAFAALGLCVPSYLWLEQGSFDEPVGLFCFLTGALGITVVASGIVRAACAVIRSTVFERQCRMTGRPYLALTGIVRPRVIISQSVTNTLSAEELEVVMSHEDAHLRSHDNLKRLCLLLAPGSKALERAWMRSAEYSADRHAVRGDARRALALASALVRVARLGGTAHLSPVTTSFLADASELSDRVNRLLNTTSADDPPSRPRGTIWLALLITAALLYPATLPVVHSILERLLSLVVLSPLR